MTIATLAPCRWRGSEPEPGRHVCDSPAIMHGGTVATETCQKCGLRDHEPAVHPEIANGNGDGLLPCVYRGEPLVDERGRAKTRDCGLG